MGEQRLIDATPILQDFIKIADKVEGKNPYENVKIQAYRRCFERVLSAPTVDSVPVVHGHWIVLDDDWGYVTCNNCRCQNSIRTDYCPNCGAKMDEVEK